MKKISKMLLKILPAFIVIALAASSLSCVSALSVVEPSVGTAITSVTDIVNNIWSTFATIIQILAIAAVIICGVRYMFSGADKKADIKTQTMYIVVGAILVFAAVPLIKFVVELFNTII